MKHLTVADKSLLVGDEAADLLVDYAALLAQVHSGDRVDMNAVSSDGDEVVATFLLTPGTMLMSESTHSAMPEPANEQAIAYMRERIRSYRSPEIGIVDRIDEDDEEAS